MNRRLTIRDIAGFCPEEAIWKMMADVSTLLIEDDKGRLLTPDSIIVEGNSFMLETSTFIDATNEFLAPEHVSSQEPNIKQLVWSLGSIAYFMATGHIVFGGHGSNYQKEHPTVVLPILPKGMQELTTILHKCLCYAPDERPSMRALNNISLQGLDSCKKRQRRQTKEIQGEQEEEITNHGEKWPEEMTER